MSYPTCSGISCSADCADRDPRLRKDDVKSKSKDDVKSKSNDDSTKAQSGLLSICAADAPQFSSAVYNRGTQARKLQAGAAQSGRSMIEMLGVLAIIGVLSVGGIAGYSKAMMQYKINKATDQITQIVGSIRTLYGSQKVYSGVWDKNVWKKAHLFPDEMWNTDKTNVENPFGGDVILETADRKNGASKAFSLRYTGLPEEACMALSTYDWGSSSSSGLISISVTAGCGMGNSDYDTDACPSDDWTFCAARKEIPISVARAAARCECPDDTCDISLKFY